MISIFNQIAVRAKKLLILLIIIPLFTGVIAYYLESKKVTTYTGYATVYVGNYNYNDLKGDFSSVDKLYKSTSFLEKIKDSANGSFKIADAKSRLVITSEKNIIQLKYSGTNEKEVKKTLSEISQGFVNFNNKDYDKKMKNLKENLAETEKITSEQELAKKYEVISNIQSTIDSLKPAEVVDFTSPSAAYSNPIKRGIFGLILGLMLDAVILVTPEIFREYR